MRLSGADGDVTALRGLERALAWILVGWLSFQVGEAGHQRWNS
jgi:hypothetical protein